MFPQMSDWLQDYKICIALEGGKTIFVIQKSCNE